MSTELDTRLKKVMENPIEPDLPICDSHHHLWDRPGKRYFLKEFLRDIGGGHNIIQTVYAECKSMYRTDGPEKMRPVGETEFVQQITASYASGQSGIARIAAGIIGFADLTLSTAVAPVLEEHITAGVDRFRGIRYACYYDDNHSVIHSASKPKLLLDPKFREGFACLRDYNLCFDACIYHTQLMELVDLARAFPDISIILDHFGTPLVIGPYAGKKEEVFEEWKRGITALAGCSNVFVKLGGFGMPFYGFNWSERDIPPNSSELAEAILPYCFWCIEKFGVDRCMFESNFPVDKESYSYTVLWNAFKRITQGFSCEERFALFNRTASKVYRL